jgi:ribosome-associated protein
MELLVKSKETAIDIGKLCEDHKGENTIVLYIGDICSWTDFFVITTVRSQAHALGLMKHLNDFFYRNEISQLNYRKDIDGSGWILLDCGNIIIHLMEAGIRDFYELERLWFKGTIVYP